MARRQPRPDTGTPALPSLPPSLPPSPPPPSPLILPQQQQEEEEKEEEEAVASALNFAKEWHDASLARTQVRLPFPPSLPPFFRSLPPSLSWIISSSLVPVFD